MNARIAEIELHEVEFMREDGPVALRLPVQATLEEAYQAPLSPELRELLRHTLNGALSAPTRAAITIAQTLASPDLAPQWIGALMALDAHVEYGDCADCDTRLSACLPAAPDDGISAIRVPLNVPGRMWCEMSMMPMPDAGPMISAIAVVDLDGEIVRSARLAVVGRDARLIEAAQLLVGHPMDDQTVELVAASAAQDAGALSGLVADVTRAALKTCRYCDCA